MKPWTRNIVVNILLLSYMLLGAVGHFEVLTIYGFGTNPQHLVQGKTSAPPTTKLYWTQYKHIPTSIKISVPSPAVFAPPEFNQHHTYGVLHTQETAQNYNNSVVSLHSSRAPPLV